MRHISGAWQRTARGAGLLGSDGRPRPTIFAEMSAIASRTGAINLGQGFPDSDGPPEVLEAAQQAIAAGLNQYPPGRGTAELCQAIASHQLRFYNLTLDPETEVLVTAGATEALAASILALVGDDEAEVIVFEPFYDAYAGLVALSGARLVPVPLRWPDFQPDLDELAAAVSARTRVIVVNDPHNPTGAVFSPQVREHIVRLAIEHDAVIVTDEVYEHLVFDGRHVPIASLPGAAERTLTISSGGKTFATTGWKVGWVTGPRDLLDAVMTVKQYLTYSGGAPFQPAMAAGLSLPDAFFAEIAQTQGRRSALLGTGLRDAGFAISAPAATYFTVADVSPLGSASADDFCRRLPVAAGVVALPLSAFVSAEHRARYATLVRFAACRTDSVISEAMTRLGAAFAN
ncbi:aminotransferase class I/II-fold pyridoxal phosphate-dependent enzyme [Microbacterium sp. C7(2022)]|uniref:aminotransferase class I/II-fold pyridoxal phosphate-dependent enzyme n=1 Tax=Microbacterium sp. C7(2022) TaxID=2992759 RepID=UPI00237B7294|nr:aminotransferase class I/II-fold pyridoxal phosphate-dependent enzyme [Microbacterium sp. C7(2022)]MDE0545671.1 aminotransferase class I/II-fold pyridoxal phosphate-dependent enzyme [Microbacterium sp. C7(2022)]